MDEKKTRKGWGGINRFSRLFFIFFLVWALHARDIVLNIAVKGGWGLGFVGGLLRGGVGDGDGMGWGRGECGNTKDSCLCLFTDVKHDDGRVTEPISKL